MLRNTVASERLDARGASPILDVLDNLLKLLLLVQLFPIADKDCLIDCIRIKCRVSSLFVLLQFFMELTVG